MLSFESISVVISQKLSELDRFNIMAFFCPSTVDDLCSSGASCALVDLKGGKMFLGIFREFVKKSSELCKSLPKFPRNASK